MDLPSAKELKKLADACRKAGITHFKGSGLELAIGDAPTKEAKRKAAPKGTTEQQTAADTGAPASDAYTEEELLFWSSGAPIKGAFDESDEAVN